MRVVVDYSHVSRTVTGIERISLELFSQGALDEIDLHHAQADSIFQMILTQWIRLPIAAMGDRSSVFICPGFPPSILLSLFGADRVVPYIHDLFLLTRPSDLNFRAKTYMRPSFAFAVRRLRWFLVNSMCTRDTLLEWCRPDAEIRLLRPEVRNVFGLVPHLSRSKRDYRKPLRLLSIGTIEPRKNYPFAALIRRALAAHLDRSVELHIVGRNGWGRHAELLRAEEGVVLHDYCPTETVRALIDSADVFLATSKEEGLGLPLLEVQHGGLFVAAIDIPIFPEVLGESGCLLDPSSADKAAERIASELSTSNWAERHRITAIRNVQSWNARARSDKLDFLSWIRSPWQSHV